MKLKQWINSEQMSQGEFARSLEISRSLVSMLCNGTRSPSIDMAITIYDATEGAVSLDDWRGEG